MDLFGSTDAATANRRVAGDPGSPLAARLRPSDPAGIVGQSHLLVQGSPLRALLDGRSRSSAVLWGPPGTGKTTIARMIAGATGSEFVELSAVSATVKDVRAVIEAARLGQFSGAAAPVLFIDEVHRFSKTQQDALLPAVENGWVTWIGATTENPSFSVIAALLSRSLLLPLHPLSDADVDELIGRALAGPEGLSGRARIEADARAHIVRLAGGDARRALTLLEAAVDGAPPKREDPVQVTLEVVERASLRAAPRYDRGGTRHYDISSALIKSLRGSDVDAAVHYLAVMVAAGEDPRFIARRLMILASEDIGLADPGALSVAVAAHTAVTTIGMPEARIVLAQAVIHLALAPKSNAAYRAINAAMSDVSAGRTGPVPDHLRDASSSSARQDGAGRGYGYPHDEASGISAQQYLPEAVASARYYEPTTHGAEARAAEALPRLRARLGRG